MLLKPDYSFHSFGYEAEQKYAELAEDKKHKDWHFFRRFKMKLYQQNNRVSFRRFFLKKSAKIVFNQESVEVGTSLLAPFSLICISDEFW